jgi:nucleoside recognition membrane protein YjiH
MAGYCVFLACLGGAAISVLFLGPQTGGDPLQGALFNDLMIPFVVGLLISNILANILVSKRVKR